MLSSTPVQLRRGRFYAAPMLTARLIAGIPATNKTLFHAVRFNVGDPAACVEFIRDGKPPHRVFICRDIEMGRARQHARADAVACPRDFEPAGGLSGDRETATAQAVAECLRRQHVAKVVSDRTLPLIYADHLRQAGIALEYDPQMGVLSRRSKDAQEVEWLHAAQRATEDAMRMACETVARAAPDRNGVLMHDGERLSAERLRFMIDVHLLRLGFTNPPSIVACGPQAADCHEHGHGDLRTGQPVIVDIFPRCQKTLYNGDCTRTVVNGEPHPEVRRMHAAGWTIGNMDMTVICERPKLGGRKQEVLASLSHILGVPAEDLNLKGKTHERVDAVGEGRAVEAHVTVLLTRAK